MAAVLISPATPLPWQITPIQVLTDALRKHISALDASDTGTGKTFQALFAAKRADQRVAVICPKSVIPSWHEAAAKVGVEALFVLNIEALKADGRGYLHKENRIWRWSMPGNAILIFDEVHRFAAPDTANAKILGTAPRPVLMLSATAAGDPTKMRAIGSQLGLTSWNDWWHWCARYGCKRGHFGGIEFHGTQFHLDTLHRQIFKTGRGVRVRIADLNGQFPENRVETVAVPVDSQTAVDAAYLEELRAKEQNAKNTLEAILRARQIAEHNKLASITELARDHIESGNSVVVFVNFRDSLQYLTRELDAVGVYGEQPASWREEAIRLFQADHAHCIVVMIQAGGVGLSLHDLHGRRPRVSLLSPGWSAVELRQALGRIHRAGGKSPSLQKIIFAAGTIEERIRTKVDAKLNRIDTLNDGDLDAAENPNPMPTPNETVKRPKPTRTKSLLPALPGGTAGGNVDVQLPTHAERKHARFSPSKFKSLELCPCFEEDPNQEVHPLTLRGTRCHEALESGDLSKLEDDEERSWVAMCRDYTNDLAIGYSAILREERLEIGDGIWGFADLIMLSADARTGALVDYKFSARLQEDAETNPAAQAYVLGMFQRWPTLQTVDVHYLYPQREVISTARYQRSDELKLRLRISTIVARAQAGAKPTYHPDVCLWCVKKATCPALHEAVLPIAARYAARKDLTIPGKADFAMVKDPHTWTQLMQMAPVLEAMAESIKKHAVEFRAETGQEIPGYELRQRAGRRTINNALLAWEVAKKEGVTQEQFLRAVDVSAKRLTDVIAESAPKGEKSKAAAVLEGKLRDAGVLEVGPTLFLLARSK